MKVFFLLSLLTATASAFVAPSVVQTSSTRLYKDKETETEDEATSMDAKDISGLTAGVKTVFSSEDIDKILPHRYPFALVDKVVEYEAGKVRIGAGVSISYCCT